MDNRYIDDHGRKVFDQLLELINNYDKAVQTLDESNMVEFIELFKKISEINKLILPLIKGGSNE